MRIRFTRRVTLLPLVLALGCAQPGSAPSSPTAAGGSLALNANLSATVRFGNDSVGSKFNPASGHDQSGHGRDNLIPRTTVIDQGGTVTFVIGAPVHSVGIYADGTRIEDVNRAAALKGGCPPAPYVTGAADANLLESFEPPCAGGSFEVSYQFDTPGRYLVICTFIPHLNLGMYGWVEVRARPKS